MSKVERKNTVFEATIDVVYPASKHLAYKIEHILKNNGFFLGALDALREVLDRDVTLTNCSLIIAETNYYCTV